MTRFRFLNPDKSVRLNIDSDSDTGVFITPPIVLGEASPAYEPLHASNANGMNQAGVHFREIEMLVPIRFHKQDSMDGLIDMWTELAKELNRIGLIEYRLEGSTKSYFIDFYRSPLPSLHRASSFPWWDQLEIAEPYILKITRHPQIHDADGVVAWI